MKALPVYVENRRRMIRPSPGFAKKRLADAHLELLALCGFGCAYCSSNDGNYLRVNRGVFAFAANAQTGRAWTPAKNPALTLEYRRVIEQLEREIAAARPGLGRGEVLVMSQLTDAFSPRMVASGTTRRALELLLARTEYGIRILTKSAVIGSRRWLGFLAEHADRMLVGCSIGTTDDAFARRMERGTSSPRARMAAIRALQDAGVPTFGMLCPVFPGHIRHIPAVLRGIRSERLVEVFAEPYNDRKNWGAVAAAHSEGAERDRFVSMFSGRDRSAWSRYAADLYRVMQNEVDHGRLRYLLYEADIAQADAGAFAGLRGVLLQSKPGKDGLSRNAAMADVQRHARGEPGAW